MRGMDSELFGTPGRIVPGPAWRAPGDGLDHCGLRPSPRRALAGHPTRLAPPHLWEGAVSIEDLTLLLTPRPWLWVPLAAYAPMGCR
jgi:hypothetical protein